MTSRFIREYTVLCYDSRSLLSLDDGNKQTVINKWCHPVNMVSVSATTPIRIWSGEIKKFSYKRFLTEKLYPWYFSQFEFANNYEDLIRYNILRETVHNNFHLIDRQ